jgi:hypothetical protein
VSKTGPSELTTGWKTKSTSKTETGRDPEVAATAGTDARTEDLLWDEKIDAGKIRSDMGGRRKLDQNSGAVIGSGTADSTKLNRAGLN